MINIAVLLSGRGSNFRAIKENIDNGYIKGARIAVVFSNIETAAGLVYARSCGIPTLCIPSKGRKDRDAYDGEIIAALEPYDIGLICLAGYMRIVTDAFINRYENKMINIHPSLLPSFPGLHAQKQALEYGVRFSGCTVHFVDSGLDSGAIIIQHVVPVMSGDTEETLSARILREEHKAYPEAVKLFSESMLGVDGRTVLVKGC